MYMYVYIHGISMISQKQTRSHDVTDVTPVPPQRILRGHAARHGDGDAMRHQGIEPETPEAKT